MECSIQGLGKTFEWQGYSSHVFSTVTCCVWPGHYYETCWHSALCLGQLGGSCVRSVAVTRRKVESLDMAFGPPHADSDRVSRITEAIVISRMLICESIKECQMLEVWLSHGYGTGAQ